ncbi:uncharacterized protein LOC111050725 [Nilaparvata lugens]|uniref:uncharacterized protein LOC111050725 n=1 Tax=Nilaparvata lugens TaxID=108931 RepID=UPI00193D5670|nr:uncharacterized protein LOC111050725 [Nilaparvata lugens]XP_039289322.1 uncharacterized protein LOC111050725 [Nilaparvata lugens]
MMEYVTENLVLKVLPERIHFVFGKHDLSSIMKRNVKVFNKSPAPIKMKICPSQTETFTYKHEYKTKVVPGIPLTVTIEFKPIKEIEYTDWLSISCQEAGAISLPVIAVPYVGKISAITDACSENVSSHNNRLSQCIVLNGQKQIKKVSHKKRYRKIVRFRLDSKFFSHKYRIGINSKTSTKFTQHDVNTALMKKPSTISDDQEQLGPDGLSQNGYLKRKKIHEKEFFDKVIEIQLQDSSVERNPNVLRLFSPEISSEEIAKVEEYRRLQEKEDKDILIENDGPHPIHVCQKLITRTRSDQIINWKPSNETPDFWIFRYEALWKFIQAARSIIIYNRLAKRLETLKVFHNMFHAPTEVTRNRSTKNSSFRPSDV